MSVTRVLLNRCPPGRATSRISITTMTGLENSPPKMPAMPASVFTWKSSLSSPRRWATQLPTPPPIEASTFSGPTLAPPISDTAETATVPGTSPRVDALGLQVVEQAGNLLGQAGQSPQQANHDAGRGGDRHPPPVTAEPPWTGIGVPPSPVLDYP